MVEPGLRGEHAQGQHGHGRGVHRHRPAGEVPAAPPTTERLLHQVVGQPAEHPDDHHADHDGRRRQATEVAARHDDHGEVPQVDRVGPVPHDLHRADGQPAGHPGALPTGLGAGEQQQDGAGHRGQRDHAGDRGGRRQHQGRGHDEQQPDRREHPRAPAHRRTTVQDDGEQRARPELPAAGQRREVGGVGRGVGRPGRPREGGEHQHRQDVLDRGHRVTTPAQRQPGDDQQQHRPDEVELLLHRQRPVVLQRGDRPSLGEVVGLDQREADVGGEQRRPPRVGEDLPHPHDRQDQGGDAAGGDQHDRGCGEDAAGATGVEVHQGAAQPGGVGALACPQQQSGDQEAGDDEEDVDPEVAPGDRVDAEVGDDHEQDRDGAEALDVAPHRSSDWFRLR